jgi:hypothetical protein
MMGEWSGTGQGWRREAYPVTAGNKTFRWVYSKDGNTNGGADKAWIDNVTFPQPVCLTIWAGPNEGRCGGDTFQPNEAYGTDYTTIEWVTSGTGTFNDPTVMHPVYSPSAGDIASGSVDLTLTLWNAEGDQVSDDMELVFKTAPEAAPTPAGPDYVDVFVTVSTDYTTTGITDLTEYSWEISPAEAGTIAGSGLSATVTWNPDYLGMAYITVAAINECGIGTPSESFEVTVDNTVGLGDPDAGTGLSVYPNPGQGIYQVSLDTGAPGHYSVKVFNIIGVKVFETSYVTQCPIHETINLENLPRGVYFLKAEGEGFKAVKKITKK